MDWDHLPTPAVVIDLATVQRNLGRMADYCRDHGLSLRPHTKTHKSVRMAKLQMESGAAGLAIAKAGEAAVMAEAADDLLVAYPALDPARCARLSSLAGSKTVRVAVDTETAVERIAGAARQAGTTIGILVDIDIGSHRTGVGSPEAALALARHVDRTRGAMLDGIMCYAGHIKRPPEEQEQELAPVEAMLRRTLELWGKNGFEARIVSGGSTPSARQSHLVPSLTEIRPGTYIYNDWNQVTRGVCSEADCAARLLCTVVSDAVPGKRVIDAGSKALSSDRLAVDPEEGGYGRLVDYPEARMVRLTEEHGEVDISRCAAPPRLGDRVWVIPNHICPCVNLFDAAWVREADGNLEPLPIEARGKVV